MPRICCAAERDKADARAQGGTGSLGTPTPLTLTLTLIRKPYPVTSSFGVSPRGAFFAFAKTPFPFVVYSISRPCRRPAVVVVVVVAVVVKELMSPMLRCS